MTMTAKIREMASTSTVEVLLTDGRLFVVQAPEHVGGSPSGDQLVLPFGDSLVLVESDEIAEVRVAVPDPDVEALRRGEVPEWMRYRLCERPELFLRVARTDPEVLGRVEDHLER
jgi:hypothetical protein